MLPSTSTPAPSLGAVPLHVSSPSLSDQPARLVASPRPRAIEGSLHILAPAIARRAGAELHIGGDSCFATNDGKPHIHICALPPDDAEATLLGVGHTWHEANHIQFSDFEAIRAAKLAGLTKGLHNAIEDIYSDAQGYRQHAGARSIRNDLIALLESKGRLRAPDAQSTPAQKLEMYVYWRLAHEVWNLPVAEAHAEASERLAREAFSVPVVVKVDAMMSKVRVATSTSDCIEIAKRLVQLIEEESEDPPPPDDQDESESPGEPEQQQDADSQGHPSGPSVDQRQALKQALAASDDEHMQDLGELTGQALQQHASENASACVSVPNLPGGFSPSGGAALPDAHFDLDVRASSNAVRQRCARLLVAQTQGDVYLKRTGSVVSPRHLASYAAGDPRLFRRRADPQIETDTGVMILADRSGSTSGVISVIRQSLYASTLALEAIQRVSVAAAAFPSANGGVIPLKHFSERASSCSSLFSRLDAGGGTPMAEAMLWAGQQLAAIRKSRKLLLVVTDGQYDADLGMRVVRSLASAGINSYAIGVGHHADVPWFPYYRKIVDIAELPQAMNDVLMHAIRHEGLRS